MSVKAPQQRANWHDAFDAQLGLWQWYRSPMGQLYMRDSFESTVKGLDFDKTRELLEHMYKAERTRLLDTDPIYVSSGMCDVIEAAAPDFNPEPLLVTDLLTPRGFIYYARPFLIPDRFENPVTIQGCSWTRLFSSDSKEAVDRVHERIGQWTGSMAELEDQILAEDGWMEPHGIALTIYAETAVDESYFDDNGHARLVRELYPGPIPTIVPLHLTPWYFNMTFEGNEVTLAGTASGAEWWWRIIQTTFRLMQQRISSKGLAPVNRHARREAKKIGMRADPEVVVVRLRREAESTAEPSGESANYSHRFIVDGHWRNQWYPTEEIHRQIWISPYVKGPKDRPLIVRPKRVYQWDR